MIFSLDGVTPLIKKDNQLFCPIQGKSFQVEENLIIFDQTDDPFYEGSYMNSINYSGSNNQLIEDLYLWTINSGHLSKIKKEIPKGGNVIDLGCGGGIKYLGQRYNMLGIDLSKSSLRVASKLYKYVLAANCIQKIPLLDESVDGVISSYFWEHLHPQEKLACLKEIKRVLKPNGKVIFLYDLKTDNPFVNYYARKDNKSYKKYFLENDGHVGYETFKKNQENFIAAGFNIKKNLSLQKTFIQEPSIYIKFSSIFPRNLFLRALKFLDFPIILKPYILLVRLVDWIASFLPDRWGRITLTILNKQ